MRWVKRTAGEATMAGVEPTVRCDRGDFRTPGQFMKGLLIGAAIWGALVVGCLV